MSELVCLKCGKEMEYDWAPCPHCGWKVPEPWEEAEAEPLTTKPLLAKPNPWIQWTTWCLLVAALVTLFLWLFASRS